MLPTIQELLPTIHWLVILYTNFYHICYTNYQLRFILLLKNKSEFRESLF